LINKMSKLFDPKFASKINTMETYKQMSKTYMASDDKYKAYDSTDQIRLKNKVLAHMPMSRLNDLLTNYNNNLDTHTGDECTKRTRETSHGTKWAPIMFNTYLDKVTKRNFEYNLNYEDNAPINSNKEQRQEHWQEINQGIEQASLRWAEQCKKMFLKFYVPFADTRELQDAKNKITPTIKDNNEAKSTEKVNKKSLEYNLKTEREETMQINDKKASEKIKHPILHGPPYKTMNYHEQIILSKDKYIDKISPYPLFDPILQKTNMRSALLSKYLDKSSNRLNYWSKSYRWYTSIRKNKSNCPLKRNILHDDKWSHPCYLIKIYKISTFKYTFNGSDYVIQMDYGMIIWKKKAKIIDSLYMISRKNYNATRSLSLISFRSLGKLYKRTKFKHKKIFEPPPNYIRI